MGYARHKTVTWGTIMDVGEGIRQV